MRRFLERMRECKALREKVEAALREANDHFVEAAAVMSPEALDAALMCPKQQAHLTFGSFGGGTMLRMLKRFMPRERA